MIESVDKALTGQAFRQLLAQAACGPFKDETNDVDGVVYPLICRNVPSLVRSQVDDLCREYLGREAVNITEFLRSSPAGVHCPNPVHHDGSMGEYSLMLYLTDIGGTAFVCHKTTGISYAPEAQEAINIIASASKDVDQWRVMEFARASKNKAVLFPSKLMHAAHPIGGEGEGAQSRIVYTRFFS
jgi:hypothetical protein